MHISKPKTPSTSLSQPVFDSIDIIPSKTLKDSQLFDCSVFVLTQLIFFGTQDGSLRDTLTGGGGEQFAHMANAGEMALIVSSADIHRANTDRKERLFISNERLKYNS
jgi:hypothetical protein